MSTYFIGFGISQGDFLNSEKETVSYSNRLLRCVTDDGVDDFNVGFSGFEVKMKSSDLARCLGVEEKDVDNALKSLYKKQVEFVYAPRKNELSIVGFRPVNNK